MIPFSDLTEIYFLVSMICLNILLILTRNVLHIMHDSYFLPYYMSKLQILLCPNVAKHETTVNKLFWFQTIPVPFDQLPVELPEITEFTGKGTSPLESAKDWLRVKCPKYVVHFSGFMRNTSC